MSELKDLEIQEVSLVDEGANPQAQVVLFKREAAAEDLIARLTEKLAAMEERIEKTRLLETASKYELLGEDKHKLAQILRAAQTTGTYDRVISLLDKTLACYEKQFEEVGKVGSGATSLEQTAKQICREQPSLSWRQALDKAYQKQMR